MGIKKPLNIYITQSIFFQNRYISYPRDPQCVKKYGCELLYPSEGPGPKSPVM